MGLLKLIKAFCPACKGGRHKKMNSKTGRIIPCTLCGGSGVVKRPQTTPA